MNADPDRPTGGSDVPRDSGSDYARTVGDRVVEVVRQALRAAPGRSRPNPDHIADAVRDLFWASPPSPGDGPTMVDVVGPLWTEEHTREVLGVSRASLLERRRSGSVLALRATEGSLFYPVVQFETANGRVRVKPLLRLFMMALRDMDPWTVGVLIHTPADELGEATPLDWIRQGREADPLIAYAGLLSAEHRR